MELSSSNIKKFLIFSYISGNRKTDSPKKLNKAFCILNKTF